MFAYRGNLSLRTIPETQKNEKIGSYYKSSYMSFLAETKIFKSTGFYACRLID